MSCNIYFVWACSVLCMSHLKFINDTSDLVSERITYKQQTLITIGSKQKLWDMLQKSSHQCDMWYSQIGYPSSSNHLVVRHFHHRNDSETIEIDGEVTKADSSSKQQPRALSNLTRRQQMTLRRGAEAASFK